MEVTGIICDMIFFSLMQILVYKFSLLCYPELKYSWISKIIANVVSWTTWACGVLLVIEVHDYL